MMKPERRRQHTRGAPHTGYVSGYSTIPAGSQTCHCQCSSCILNVKAKMQPQQQQCDRMTETRAFSSQPHLLHTYHERTKSDRWLPTPASKYTLDTLYQTVLSPLTAAGFGFFTPSTSAPCKRCPGTNLHHTGAMPKL